MAGRIGSVQRAQDGKSYGFVPRPGPRLHVSRVFHVARQCERRWACWLLRWPASAGDVTAASWPRAWASPGHPCAGCRTWCTGTAA
jgi:hypothetical protein